MNFLNFDLNLLRVFDAVMSERSLTRAADRLALSQPAVSNAIKRFKESVHEELFSREAYGVKPTAYAERLWPQVRLALATLRQALEPHSYDPTAVPVNFRLAMADASSATLLPQVISRIESSGSQMSLRILPLTTRDPRGMLEHGDVDMAIGYFPLAIGAIQSQGPDSTLRHQPLHHSDYVCVMRRDHPLAEQELTLDNYCAAHHLLVSFSGRPNGFVDQALMALNRTRRIVLTCNQFFTAGRVVSESDLLTVLPASFVQATGYAHKLVERPLPMALARIQVEAVWHLRHEHDRAHQWLREGLTLAAQGLRDSIVGS